MTTEQVYKMAGTESELLSHIKSRKLRYFGHIMRLPHDNIEGSVMTGLVEGQETVEDQGHAGLTTSWRGLTSRVLICYASHETEGVGRH